MDKTTIIIIIVVLLLLSSSSGLAYYFKDDIKAKVSGESVVTPSVTTEEKK